MDCSLGGGSRSVLLPQHPDLDLKKLQPGVLTGAKTRKARPSQTLRPHPDPEAPPTQTSKGSRASLGSTGPHPPGQGGSLGGGGSLVGSQCHHTQEQQGRPQELVRPREAPPAAPAPATRWRASEGTGLRHKVQIRSRL